MFYYIILYSLRQSNTCGNFLKLGYTKIIPKNYGCRFLETSLGDFKSATQALLERQRSGQGQVIDAAMLDGANYTVLGDTWVMGARGHYDTDMRGF